MLNRGKRIPFHQNQLAKLVPLLMKRLDVLLKIKVAIAVSVLLFAMVA
nr:MAG TPA: hypothetical protein [Caudoviricetes sp.]